MIKVIALDLGGVVFSEGQGIAVQTLAQEQGYDPKITKALLASEQSIELRRGRLSDEAFWSWTKTVLPKGYDPDLIKRTYYESYVPDEGVMDLVQRLHPNYTLLAFSGNIKSRIEYLDGKYDFRRWFHKEVYSYDHGFNKPAPEFFEAMIREADVPGNEIFYVDDHTYYAPLAQEKGVHYHIYKSGEIRALETAMQNTGIKV